MSFGGLALVYQHPDSLAIAHYRESPRRPLDYVYRHGARVLEGVTNALARKLGQGPQPFLNSIVARIAAKNHGRNISGDAKLEKYCRKLLEFVHPHHMPSTRIFVFQSILQLVTQHFTDPIRQILLKCLSADGYHSPAVMVKSLWEGEENHVKDPRVEFHLGVAISCLFDTNNIAAHVEHVALPELARIDIREHSVIDKLLVASASCCQQESIIAIRYLATILDQPAFWDPKVRDHEIAAARIIRRTRELVQDLPDPGIPDALPDHDRLGTANLTRAVLVGMSRWTATFSAKAEQSLEESNYLCELKQLLDVLGWVWSDPSRSPHFSQLDPDTASKTNASDGAEWVLIPAPSSQVGDDTAATPQLSPPHSVASEMLRRASLTQQSAESKPFEEAVSLPKGVMTNDARDFEAASENSVELSPPRILAADLMQLQDISSDAFILLVVGPSGSGKSSFINRMAGRDLLAVNHGQNSSDSFTTVIAVKVRCDHATYVFLEVPGLDLGDDSAIPKASRQFFARLSEVLEKTPKNRKIRGILYCQSIVANEKQPRMNADFANLCQLYGESAYPSFIFLRTMYAQTPDNIIPAREAIWRQVWSVQLERGAQSIRFENTTETCGPVWKAIRALPSATTLAIVNSTQFPLPLSSPRATVLGISLPRRRPKHSPLR